MSNTTNYGWAYVHPTLGIGLTRGPHRSITFQSSSSPDSNGMGVASGSSKLAFDWNANPSVLSLTGTMLVNGVLSCSSNVTIAGDLTVNGTNTILNTTTLTVDDYHIEIGHTNNGNGANNATVDNAGIILKCSDGDKTILYNNARTSWEFSENIETANGKFVYTDAVKSIPSDADGLTLEATTGNVKIKATANNADIVFTVDDAGTDVTALTISGSHYGNAYFTPAAGGFLEVDDTQGKFKAYGMGVINTFFYNNNPLNTPKMQFYRARGTKASPTVSIENDSLGAIEFAGWQHWSTPSEGAGFRTAAAIVAKADGEFSSGGAGSEDQSDSPGRLEFYTTPDGEKDEVERMVIKSDGRVGIATDSPATELEVAGTASVDALQLFNSSDASVLNITYNGSSTTTIESPASTGGDILIKQSNTAAQKLVAIELATNSGNQAFIVQDNTQKELLTAYSDGKVVAGSPADQDMMPSETMTVYGGNLEVLDYNDVASNLLREGALTENPSIWTFANDFSHDTTGKKAKYTHSAGNGTLTQAESDFNGGVAAANKWYKFTYTITNSNIQGANFGITNSFASAPVTLDVSNGSGKVVYFKTGNNPGNFVISAGSTSGGFELDDVDLQQVNGGDLILHGNIVIGDATINETELEILDGLTVTTAELNVVDGNTSATSTTVADADRVVLNDGGTMKQVAVTDLAAYFDDEITEMPNLITTAATTVGALDAGSITSGFGSINVGSSAITTTGTVTGGVLAGELSTAAQPNITSVGSLTTLNVLGDAKLFDASNDVVLFMSQGGTFASPTHHRIMRVTAGGLLQFRDQIDGRIDLTIDGDGDVGIGTETPSTKLDVNGTVTATAFAGTVTTAAQTAITSVGTLTSLTVAGDLTVDTDTLYVDSAANKVGIGTTSPTNASLEIAGTDPIAMDNSGYIRWKDSGGASRGLISFNSNNNLVLGTSIDQGGVAIRGGAGGPTRLFVDYTGNVGIGVTDPDQKLEVDGAIHISGEITTPSAPADGDGGVLYTKTDGRLYWRSHEQDEIDLQTSSTVFPRKFVDGANSAYYGSNEYVVSSSLQHIIGIKTYANGNQDKGTINIRLPDATASGMVGKSYIIKDESGLAGATNDTTKQSIAVHSTGSQKIDASGSVSIESPYGAFHVYSDGTNWNIF